MKIQLFVLSSLVATMISGSQAGTVTANADSGAGSLRDALNSAISHEVIDFAPALNGTTITLTSGSLRITGLALTLDASALPSGITLSGNNSSRILTIAENADVTLRNLQLRNGREGADNGGGVYAHDSHLVLEVCSIQGCYSVYNGGGLFGDDITGSIQRCKIAGNQSDSFGGGIFLINCNPLAIANSQVSGNQSQVGGGICQLLASPSISNCSIQGNTGGGVQSYSSSIPVLRNCIVWGNSANGGTTAAQQLVNADGCRPDVDSCAIEGASDPASFSDGNLVVWGSANLDGTLAANDPEFVGAVTAANAPSSTANLRVFTGSPCLNVGDNAFGGSSLDLAGNARIQEGTIDLGAYEGGYVSFSHLYPALDPAGDENGNGVVNFIEYALGIDPSGPDDPSALPAVSTSEGSLFLTSTLRSNAIDIVPLWVTSTSLDPSSWVPMIEGVDYLPGSTRTLSASRQQVVFKLLGADPVRFYRQGFALGN